MNILGNNRSIQCRNMDLPTNYHPCRLMAYLFIIPPSHPCKEKGDETLSYFINAWVAVVYYHIYCDPRSYSNALALFGE